LDETRRDDPDEGPHPRCNALGTFKDTLQADQITVDRILHEEQNKNSLSERRGRLFPADDQSEPVSVPSGPFEDCPSCSAENSLYRHALGGRSGPGYREAPFNLSYPKMLSSWYVLGPQVMYWAPRFVLSLWQTKEIHITEKRLLRG
jgi:hypothetical protein